MSAVFETGNLHSQQTFIFYQFLGTAMSKERYVQEKKVSRGTINIYKYTAEKYRETDPETIQ